MIGSAGAVAAARERGAVVVTPPTLGVGLLEFHQMDRMVQAGRQAGRAVLDRLAEDADASAAWSLPAAREPVDPLSIELPHLPQHATQSP